MDKKLQRASEYFKISASDYKKTGAFDPVIGVDSLFFVDPLLLSRTSIPEFRDALEEVRKYFSDIILLLRVNNDKATKLALRKLILKEVRGIGIGYGSESDDGSAIGSELASRLLKTAKELIRMGVSDPAIFEVMGLFEEDFGPDRLSDALIRILLKRIFAYSERVTKDLSITETYIEKSYEREYVLAKHPLKDGPIIFIPDEILRDLPLATSFDEISSVVVFNEGLREKFNEMLSGCFIKKDGKEPNKSDIRKYILETKERVKNIVEIYTSCIPKSYDLDKDPKGLHRWLEKAKDLVKENPLLIPTSLQKEDLDAVVLKIINTFKKVIETKGIWKSLYNDEGEALNESHARHFFYATAHGYCEFSDIDISPESNAGQGPVDFKLSKGHSKKIVVEVKLTSGSVKHGYEKQTRIYEESEEASKSYFLVIQNTEKSKALDDILKMEEEENKQNKKHPEIIRVDARKQLSASKRK